MINTAQVAGPCASRPSSLWKPILEGELHAHSLEVIDEIAIALRQRIRVGPAPAKTSLMGGGIGIAVFFSYLAQARPGEGHEALARELLYQGIEARGRGLPNSLYGGLTGLAWAAQHLQEKVPELDVDFLLEEHDEELERYVVRSPWRQDYDLVQGLVGLGLYALHRLPRPSAQTCLKRIVDRLDEIAVPQASGITWFTPPYLLVEAQRHDAPEGWYNAGVAHGVPGVIAFLGRICAAGVAGTQARRLLDGAIAWLRAQRLCRGATFTFPAWLVRGREPRPTRLAWCYGDAGIAAALLATSRILGEAAWEREALDLAAASLNGHPGELGVQDAGLCHGAAGLGHVFNRLHQATGDDRFREAARSWLRRTLEMRRPGEGVAGYKYLSANKAPGASVWMDDPGILTGAAGIGLALLAASTPVEPDWDRLLLLSFPPR